jgi:hypothetical protein
VTTTLPNFGSTSQTALLPYTVTVGPASVALVARVDSEAASPPQPISEPTARTMALDALNALAQSSNTKLRSPAQLIQGLANVVLGHTDPNTPAS